MFCESLSSTFLIKKKMLRFQRSIFRVYMDRFNRKKDPIVMFMGHLGVPTKKIVKGNEVLYFISAFCVAPTMLIILFTSPAGLLGCYMLSDNSFSCFRRKAF